MIHTTLPLVAETAQPLTWTLIRSTGIVAMALLTLGVVAGIAAPSIRKPSWRLTTQSIHTTAAVSGTLLLAGHVVAAIADSYIEISPLAAIVPGLSVWEPLWISLGVVAVDLIAVVIVTSVLRDRLPKTWRSLHLLAYPALALAWGHALTVGTDRMSQPMILFAVVSFASIAGAMLLRLTFPGRPTTRVTKGSNTATGSDRPIGRETSDVRS